ncbi:hypothetical protein DFH11DRAFT_1637497, partial [Phellopilus nigrolimitatus]
MCFARQVPESKIGSNLSKWLGHASARGAPRIVLETIMLHSVALPAPLNNEERGLLQLGKALGAHASTCASRSYRNVATANRFLGRQRVLCVRNRLQGNGVGRFENSRPRSGRPVHAQIVGMNNKASRHFASPRRPNFAARCILPFLQSSPAALRWSCARTLQACASTCASPCPLRSQTGMGQSRMGGPHSGCPARTLQVLHVSRIYQKRPLCRWRALCFHSDT